jgi:mannose-6-phosphate isomerase
MLEACLALFEVSGEMAFWNFAQAIVDLALARMIDHATGTIAEVFTMRWSPVAHHGKIRVEPGHQLEWAWLLLEFMRLSPDRIRGLLFGRCHPPWRTGVKASDAWRGRHL